jgi:hypothetical protein
MDVDERGTAVLGIGHRIPLLEDILDSWASDIGEAYAGYRNHVYRVVQTSWMFRWV